MQAETIVYYDANYTSVWIDHRKGYPQKIANAFSKKEYRILDANSLKTFMVEALENGTANQKLVVFAQDVAPAPIVETISSQTTLREYLDAGGSALWIGDIPLYYRGVPAKDQTEEEIEKSRIEISKEGGPTAVLGVIPVYGTAKMSVSITTLGRSMGLRSKWSGMRPIIQDRGIKPLARSESILCIHYIDIERRKNIFRRFAERISGGISVKALPIEFKLGTEAKQKEPPKGVPHAHETHVNAWVKNFNSYYPKSGFYRIWDYPPITLSEKMLNELIGISERIAFRIGNQSQAFFISEVNRKT